MHEPGQVWKEAAISEFAMCDGLFNKEKAMDYINEAYKEALKCSKSDDVPVGAIIICGDKIIARAHNQKEKRKDPLAHAEVLAIRKASRKLKTWHLNDCKMYVTLEPCAMCSSIIKEARIKEVFYGAKDSKEKGISNDKEIISTCLNHEESSLIVKRFFEGKR